MTIIIFTCFSHPVLQQTRILPGMWEKNSPNQYYEVLKNPAWSVSGKYLTSIKIIML